MRKLRWALAALAVAAAGLFSLAPAAAPVRADAGKRLLVVTDSGGFIHDSVGVAEEVLKEVGPKEGFAVTAWRFTREPDPKVLEKYSDNFRKKTGLTVGPENCGRINKETLKNFDCVLFFTTGNPVNKAELADLVDWVKAGGAFAGTHCATDTLYQDTVYGELLGAYFRGHPAGLQKIKVKVEDPKHPAAAGFGNGVDYHAEM